MHVHKSEKKFRSENKTRPDQITCSEHTEWNTAPDNCMCL